MEIEMAVKMKSKATALKTGMVNVADLTEYDNNPRKNDAAVPDMVTLIERFGFRVPILTKGNRIVDGHLRVKAARSMGLVSIPAIDVGDMSEAEERALRIALNKSVEWAEWDHDKLTIEFDAIKGADLDLGLTGFDTKEIDKIAKSLEAAVKVPKNKGADAGMPADPNYVSLTFHMSAKDRDAVMKMLEETRKEEQLGNVSQALVYIASNFKDD